MNPFWTGIFEKALAPILLAIVGFLIRFYTEMEKVKDRVERIEPVCKERGCVLARIVEVQTHQEVKFAVVDAAIAALKDMAPDLKNMVTLTAKMEALLETTNRRLEILEDLHLTNRQTTRTVEE